MNVDLDKQDLIFLVKGCSPAWKVQSHYLIVEHGRYSDLSGWMWDGDKLEKADDIVLWDLYKKCKESKQEPIKGE